MATVKSSISAETQSRHTPYPYYSLQKALEVAGVVNELGGSNSDVQKSVIAHRLEMEEDSPTLMGILGAARLFNQIEGRGSYRLTEPARSYFYPTSEHDKRLALLHMVNGPPLFSALIERFDGTRLPSSEVLINILHRDHHVAKSWQTRAASLFLNSMREAQLIDGGGFLRFKASFHGASNGTIPVMKEAVQVAQSFSESGPAPSNSVVESQQTIPLIDSRVASWHFRGIQLVTPSTMTMELWKKLSDYVNVLKPDNNEQ